LSDVGSAVMFYNEGKVKHVSAAKYVLDNNVCDIYIQSTIKCYCMFQFLRYSRQEYSLRQTWYLKQIIFPHNIFMCTYYVTESKFTSLVSSWFKLLSKSRNKHKIRIAAILVFGRGENNVPKKKYYILTEV
jgi:hypothetical protein